MRGYAPEQLADLNAYLARRASGPGRTKQQQYEALVAERVEIAPGRFKPLGGCTREDLRAAAALLRATKNGGAR